MFVISFFVLAVVQVSLGKCVDNEHVTSPCECPQPEFASPCARFRGPCCGPAFLCCQPQSSPCGFPCSCFQGNWQSNNDFPCCIQSFTKLGHCPWEYGPVLQSGLHSPLYSSPCCRPLIPIVKKHIGHTIIKTVKHVPIIHKYCKPELVIRTRQVPIMKHRKRVVVEPVPCHVPVTDKLIRHVIHSVVHRVPVVQKCVKPYTYQTIHHVPAPCKPVVTKCVTKHHAPRPCGCPRSFRPPFPMGRVPQRHFPVNPLNNFQQCDFSWQDACDNYQGPCQFPCRG